MLTVYLICYNEAMMLQFTVNHYRKRFPDVEIIVYDNFSTDNTVDIAKFMGCKVFSFFTGDKLSDQAFINIKNNCWKNATTQWVIVSDCDEVMKIDYFDLKREKSSILRTRYIQMVSQSGHPFSTIEGYKYPGDNKMICFDRTRIQEINYDYGCHTAMPFGDIEFSEYAYEILHFKYLSLDYVIKRHREFGKRLSQHNLKKKLSYHYLFSERKIRKYYHLLVKNSKRHTL